VGVIAYYVMDGNRPLTAATGSDTTSYLYGLGVIGEESNAWSYGLTDGTNPSITLRASTQRQLTDAVGEVTYSARYTPWGDTLESYGSGNFTFGYFGGLMDAATGLLYVGDGQYYDPSTGRFLTRGSNPSSPNPYLPFDPTGALFLPLALVSLAYGRKRRKSKWDILVIVTLLGLSAGMGVAACQFTTNGYDVTATPSPTQPNTYNVTATPTTVPSSTPAPSNTPLPTITTTCTLTPSPTPTPQVPTPIYEDRYYKIYNTLLDPQYRNYWWRTMDDGVEMIMAVMSYLEFRTIKDDSGYIKATTDALSNRYRYACRAGCPIVNGVLDGGFRWIMLWSHSLMQLENGMTRDLEQSSINPSFAKSMGESIIRNSTPYDYDKPFGAFNPQTDKEFKYFSGKHKFNGDTNYDGVYWLSPEGAKSRPVAIVITHRQEKVHCTTNNPEYGADKGITCGN
jgi:RHS repeat-associated protein